MLSLQRGPEAGHRFLVEERADLASGPRFKARIPGKRNAACRVSRRTRTDLGPERPRQNRRLSACGHQRGGAYPAQAPVRHKNG